jgi:predicted transcriptional regulator
MEKAKEKPHEFFKSTKTSLKSILKHPEINTTKINDVVIKAHKIVIHTLQFLKMYTLHHYQTHSQTIPIIDKVLILNVMKVVAIQLVDVVQTHLTNVCAGISVFASVPVPPLIPIVTGFDVIKLYVLPDIPLIFAM